MKRLITIFAVLFTAVILSTAVAADSTNTYTVSPYRATIRNYDRAFTAIYNALSEYSDSVSLAGYGIKSKDIGHIYRDVKNSSPELFYADNKITYYIDPWDNVTSVSLGYTMSQEEAADALKIYEQEISYVTSLVSPSLSDAEKALFVHDYMVSSFSYDESATNFDAFSLFKERTGVCQAYSLAYMAVLRELGIEAVMVTSDEMVHAWNLVKIDGEWYHVDLSFDDPTPDRPGRVMHDNFLLDDDGIRATDTPHFGWGSAERCDSATFHGRIWNNVRSRMLWLDGQWYYIDETSRALIAASFSGTNKTEVYRFPERWMAGYSSGSYYVGVFSGLSECFGYLFVNTPYEVIIFTPDTGHTNVFLELTEADIAAGRKIYGSTIYKYALEYSISDTPNAYTPDIRRFEITSFDSREFGEKLPFTDVMRYDSYYAAVKFVYNRGLFRGVSSTKFAPNAYLTRSMFVTVLGRLCEVDERRYSTVRFDDVDDDQWYTPYVAWAAETGIVNGIGGNLFNPMGELTKEQMYKIVALCGEYLGIGDKDTSGTLILYSDRTDISPWAYDSVAYCKKNSLIADKSSDMLRPTMRATRAEAAEIISRFSLLFGNS